MATPILQTMDTHFPVGGTINTSLTGESIILRVEIGIKYQAVVDFTYLRKPYSFTIDKWSGRGFSAFLLLFFEHAERDPAIYGEIDEEGVYNGSYRNKVACVAHAIKDVMHCLDQIVTAQGRSVLDYATWFRENHSYDTYPHYITKVTCHCIVHSDFMAGNVRYELTLFEDPE